MVNVILCTYNGQDYIKEQIYSILGQTYQNFIISIYDDSSNDGTGKVLQEFAENFPEKIRLYFRSKPTGSACHNFLMAITEAEAADYYMLSDQDDVWHKTKMARMVHFVEKTDPSVPYLCQCDSRVVNEKLDVISNSFMSYCGIDFHKKSFSAQLLENNITGGAVLFNEKLRQLIASIPKDASMHDAWLGLVAKAFGQYEFLPEILYDYRQHNSNTLGAHKGGFIRKFVNRLGFLGSSCDEMNTIVAGNYLRMKSQAQEFKILYSDYLTENQKEIIDAFCELEYAGKIAKAKTVFYYGFTYSKWYQTIGNLILG